MELVSAATVGSMGLVEMEFDTTFHGSFGITCRVNYYTSLYELILMYKKQAQSQLRRVSAWALKIQDLLCSIIT